MKLQVFALTQWFPTGVPWQPRVPRDPFKRLQHRYCCCNSSRQLTAHVLLLISLKHARAGCCCVTCPDPLHPSQEQSCMSQFHSRASVCRNVKGVGSGRAAQQKAAPACFRLIKTLMSNRACTCYSPSWASCAAVQGVLLPGDSQTQLRSTKSSSQPGILLHSKK